MQNQSKSANVQDTPEFIKKLRLMINDHPHIIDFSEEGDEIFIFNKQIFTQELLPQYFRHNKWRSFIRQMNMYQFKKISRGIHSLIFQNRHFKQGNEQNYHLIKRKTHEKDNQMNSMIEIYQKTQNQLDKQYNFGSITMFMNKAMEIHMGVTQCLAELQCTTEIISKQKKSNQIKPKIGALRQSFQMVQQSSVKMLAYLQKYSESSTIDSEYKYRENSGTKKNNLVIPIIQPQEERQQKAVQKIEQIPIKQKKTQKNQDGVHNLLEITPGGSFSSFNILN